MSLALKLYQRRSLASLAQFLEAARLQGPSKAFAVTVDKGLRTIYKPMPHGEGVPYVCLRIPTGGGKTVMGAHIIQAAGTAYLEREFPLVLWLVPTTQIKTQTLEAFRDPRHPYREELDDAFDGQVAVFDLADFAQIRPSDLGTKVCIVIATVAALRVEATEGRKVYQHNENLEPHFGGAIQQLDYLERGEDGKVLYSFANLLALHGPLVIMDEAHNANTPLSYDVYDRLSPKVVVELTATPDGDSSNILVSVSAFELKAEDMIKFPVVLKEHAGEWTTAVSASVARRKTLAKIAMGEPEYIRPILLIQAENARGTATVEEVKKHLIDVDGVDEATIAIATGDQREIEGIDLFATDCPIEIIITKQALKEGWDCSFAYVFCSVAQVKSDKDIQQLLGRVLRMPYAVRRKQPDMSKAYAHVVSPNFGEAAAELTKALVHIGFNPLEAMAAIRRDSPQETLPLKNGQVHPVRLPKTRLEVTREPDLSQIPERDRERVVFTPNTEGRGGSIELTDELDNATVEAIVAAVPASKREELGAKIELHQQATAAAKAPSELGEVFQVPRLCVMEQGELELVDKGAVSANFTWDLLAYPADLSSFSFNDQTMTFEIDLEGEKVGYHTVKDDVVTYLPGFAQDRTVTDLLGWLDHELRVPNIKQPVLFAWIRQAITSLTDGRGFSLAQLLKGQFVLRRKLREQLDKAKAAAYGEGFQELMFNSEIETSSAPDHAFTYPPDFSMYPAHSYYQGDYRFQKHYYPVPADLKWRTDSGKETEEFQCARALDMIDSVKFWVRNVVHPTQFWMPTSTNRTYPDFVTRLEDGRLLVIEYKGGDRFSNDDSEEKRSIGDLWAKRSGGEGVYLMAQKVDEQGRNVRDQILLAIGSPAL
jgi:type III restriction enzyme